MTLRGKGVDKVGRRTLNFKRKMRSRSRYLEFSMNMDGGDEQDETTLDAGGHCGNGVLCNSWDDGENSFHEEQLSSSMPLPLSDATTHRPLVSSPTPSCFTGCNHGRIDTTSNERRSDGGDILDQDCKHSRCNYGTSSKSRISKQNIDHRQLQLQQRRHRQRHGVITKTSLVTTCVTIALFSILSIYAAYLSIPDIQSSSRSSINAGGEQDILHNTNRGLKNTNLNDNDNINDDYTKQQENEETIMDIYKYSSSNNAIDDYSSYSCGEIFQLPKKLTKSQQCIYAHECDEGEGIFLPQVFCSTQHSVKFLSIVLAPFLILALVTVFRMLGSTAEDYFSPALEMFSVKMGLPPRFAGVSLLALGNGAADVSATMNAIQIDPTNGYLLSLGALTGAGMFIATVVAGLVIVTANGVPCRGALVRDVSMFMLTLLVVYVEFASGSIGRGSVTIFIAMYVIFVAVVLAADLYHRQVVQPRMEALSEIRERQRQLEEGRRAKLAAVRAAMKNNEIAQVDRNEIDINDDTELKFTFNEFERQPSVTILNSSERTEIALTDDEEEALASEEGLGVVSAVARKKTKNGRLGKIMEALSNYGIQRSEPDIYDPSSPRASGWGIEEEDGTERLVVFHGRQGGAVNVNNSNANRLTCAAEDYRRMGDASLEVEDDDVCLGGGIIVLSSASWADACAEGREEFFCHWRAVWDDVYCNEENNLLDKILLSCELPFIVLRKITVPIPCDGYYCRPLIALSLALSPLWLGFYAWMECDINLFTFGPGVPYLLIFLVISLCVGAVVLRCAPRTEGGSLAQHFSVPIALFGFAVAATWIDTIADQLVHLLAFLGIVCRIPNVIMGVTILAWGNSMADLSANITMARKGLANMAITACFAGPVFNILIGLGAGFSALLTKTGNGVANVSDFPPTAKAGFIFLVLNCFMVLFSGLVWHKGRIPRQYGYGALALYATYLISAIWLYYK